MRFPTLRKLSALNLVFLLLISLLPPLKAAAAGHQYAHYLVIDGQEYNADLNQEGQGWYIFAPELGEPVQLDLYDYHGGPIQGNVDIMLSLQGNSTVTSEIGCGISSTGSISIGASSYNYTTSRLTVTGGDGHPAIQAGKELFVSRGLTAQGGGAPALVGRPLEIHAYSDDTDFYCGSSAQTAQKTAYYNGQDYVRLEPIAYTMTLCGNGGVTEATQTQYSIRNESGTPGELYLYHLPVFQREGTHQVSWIAPSGTYYPLDSTYFYPGSSREATLSAVWSDDQHKGITLNSFYGPHGDSLCGGWPVSYDGSTIVDMVFTGNTYTLPNQVRSGCTFLGWQAPDKKLHPAGEVITVQKDLSFTAQFAQKKLYIDGREYPAGHISGGHEQGWIYYGNQGGERAQLDIFSNYSGLPIQLPSSTHINLYQSVSNTAPAPAIEVHGDAVICTYTNAPLQLTGGSSAPAVRAEGSLTVYSWKGSSLTMTGGQGAAAIVADSLSLFDTILCTGLDQEKLAIRDSYADEHCVLLAYGDRFSFRFTGPCKVPAPTDMNCMDFLGWRDTASDAADPQKTSWHMPGDSIPASTDMTLETVYIPTFRFPPYHSDSIAQRIDANGGHTPSGSRYYIAFCPAEDFGNMALPDRNCIKRDGFYLREYNTAPDGSGTSFAPGAPITDAPDTNIYTLYAQWAPARQSGISEKSGLSWALLEDGRLLCSPRTPPTGPILVAAYRGGQLLGLSRCETDQIKPMSLPAQADQCKVFVIGPNWNPNDMVQIDLSSSFPKHQ